MTENSNTPSNNDNEARLAKIVSDALLGNSSLGAELGLGPDELEALYGIAYNLYNAGKFTDAMKMFALLTMLSPLDYRFTFGGASCFQMLGEYMMASIYYQLAAGLDPETPVPMLHTAECLLALKDKDGARFALEQALQRASSAPEHQVLRQKAEVMLENMGK